MSNAIVYYARDRPINLSCRAYHLNSYNGDNKMKKYMSFSLVLALLLSMAVPAYASENIHNTEYQNNTQVVFSLSETEGNLHSTNTIGVPEVSEARFYHSAPIASMKNRLQISWNSIDNATGYEVKVMKADGTTTIYSVASAMLILRNTTCPRVYDEATNIWKSASVQVRAVTENGIGSWSNAHSIGCDQIH